MVQPVHCDLCGQTIAANSHYVVRIDVFADPSVPAMSTDELSQLGSADAIAQILEELKQYSADELQDQVHRRFEFKLCRPCQMKFLANPLGRPRTGRIGEN